VPRCDRPDVLLRHPPAADAVQPPEQHDSTQKDRFTCASNIHMLCTLQVAA
jgi:hypothetical protein